MNHLIRQLLKIIFILFPLLLFSQEHTDVVNATSEYKKVGDMEGALDFNAQVLKKYLQENNILGITTTYINISGLFFSQNDFNESLIYLDKAKKRINEVNDPLVLAGYYLSYGANYSSLNLSQQSNINLNRSLYYSQKSTADSKYKRKLLFLATIWKWDNFERLKNLDSVNYIKKNALKYFSTEPLVYNKIADHFIENKSYLDSAEYYLNKGISFPTNHFEEKGILFTSYGNLYIQQKNYPKALEFYQKALSVYEKMKRKKSSLDVYKHISKTYGLMNDAENEAIYLKKQTLLRENIETEERKIYRHILEKIDVEKNEESEKNRNIFYISIGILIIISCIITYFVHKAYKKIHLLKDKTISEKSHETDELKKKLKVAFDEVRQLAKSGDPLFLARFKEVYPEFFEKIKNINNDLTEHDVKFAAYMRLKLTNKEILQFENTTLRAIEMKKYRLKKKFDLPPDVDFSKWIVDL
ncbi:tetratricopeptide repeat protein [Chryseobacterium sp. MMS23-Vi53]|uniref:tetratricopeptide repeat protein n=1 Tax=Chryseobacterium sp. MMS23-Vi53 TaxID=3386644 RepID=UPI0039E9BFA3